MEGHLILGLRSADKQTNNQIKTNTETNRQSDKQKKLNKQTIKIQTIKHTNKKRPTEQTNKQTT